MADEAGRSGAADCDTVVYGVTTDSEFVPENWRLHHADLNALSIPMPADIKRERSAYPGVLVAYAGRGARRSWSIQTGSCATGARRAAKRPAVPRQSEQGR